MLWYNVGHMSIKHTVEEIGARMDALGLWKLLEPYNFAVKPRGTVFPYFCTVLWGDRKPVKVRFLMLEGWQTLHDYVRTRIDRNFGFYSSPIEMPHLELVILEDGTMKLFRHDTGYMPCEANEVQRSLATRILWEAYGVMLRVESDNRMPMKFSDEKAIFARVETAAEKWEDRPLEIPDPPPHTEKVSFSKVDIKAAQDLPFVKDEVLELDFGLLPSVMTKEARPRCVYELKAIDPNTGEAAITSRVSIHPEAGLKGMWESMPVQVLKELIRRGKVPGELKTRSGRVFRMLRPLCMELPFKLSLHDKLESFEGKV